MGFGTHMILEAVPHGLPQAETATSTSTGHHAMDRRHVSKAEER
jgi:hypothetical protein